MRDLSKTKKQLIDELTALRKQAAEINKEHSFNLSVIANAAEGISVCHNIPEYPYDKFTVWNNRMTEITGYTMEEINKNGWYQTVYPDPETQARAVERMERMRQGDELHAEPWEITRKDGEKRILSITTSIIEAEEGSIHVMAIMDDITELKKAEQALTQFRFMVEGSGEEAYLVKPDGSLVYINEAAARSLGYSVKEMLQIGIKGFDPLFGPKFGDHFEDLKKRSVPPFETTHIAKDGRAVIKEIKSVYLNMDGNEYVCGFGCDITDRKRIERELLGREEKMQSIFRVAPTGIGVVKERILLDVNSRICEMTGYSKEELVGKSARIFYPTQEDFEYVGTEKYRQIAEKGTGVVETCWMKKDGTIMNVILASTPIDLSDLSKGVTFTALDITEQKKAEESLQESEKQLKLILESIQAGIMLIDPEKHIIIEVNPEAAKIIGLPREKLVGAVCHKYVCSSELGQCPITDLGQSMDNSDRVLLTNNGEQRSILKTVVPVTIHGRKHLLESFVDITERKKSETALIESDKFIRTVIDLVPHFIFVKNEQSRFMLANKALAEAYGTTTHDIIGKSDIDFSASPEEAEHFHKDDLDVIRSGVPKIIPEEKITDSTGMQRYLQTAKIPFRFGTEGIPCILGVAIDITEHKRAEEALHISEEKYRLVVENASDAVFILQDETIKFPNRQSMAMSGYTEKELTDVHFPNFLHADDKDVVMDLHRKRLQGEDVPATYSFRIINKAGEAIWVEISAALILWEGRIATLNFLRDITIQKKLEAQLLQAQKMEAIGQLAGGVAHDFNNLLTAVIGYGHLLKKETSQDTRMSAFVGHILNAAERAAILTNDLLTFSRKQIINLQPVNLNKIIKDMESLLLRVIGEDIELTTVLTESDLTIMADSSQIDQILMNLATNAQDAMPEGGSLIISTERVEINDEYIKAYGYGKRGNYALLSVEDTGTGVEERIKERIFEPFFTTKEVGKGTGLGLSMVYGIVNQHDGYINAYSESGRGTTFKILLPLIQSKVEELQCHDIIKVKGGTETILIGEDDTHVRNLLKEVLSHAGYHILEAFDGNDTIEVFNKNRDQIHLLILDVIMPKKNGKEVYAEIKKVKSDMKTIFLSGYGADIIHKKGILEDGLNFITKPVSPDELLLRIRDVLDK